MAESKLGSLSMSAADTVSFAPISPMSRLRAACLPIPLKASSQRRFASTQLSGEQTVARGIPENGLGRPCTA